MALIRKWSDEQLEFAVKSSRSMRDVLFQLGLSNGANNYRRVTKRIKELGLSFEHFRTKNDRRPRYLESEVFKVGKPVREATLRRFAKVHIIYECEICKNVGVHLDKPLTLQLDHVNGNRNDNRKENLRWLCPNCHTQTITFCGKNKRVDSSVVER